VFGLISTHGTETSTVEIENISKSFHQLDDLVGLLARYAVMQNLYYNLPVVTLTAEYRRALLDICVAIVTYFAHAFTVARILRDPQGEQEKAAESRNRCDELIGIIKEKDQASRRFRVVVAVDEKSETEVQDVESRPLDVSAV
jgi:hypothetical protein